MEDLKKHVELVDKCANAVAIREAQRWREEEHAKVLSQEKEISVKQYQSLLSWLDYQESEQQDFIDDIASNCHPGTVEWVHKNAKVQAWLRNSREQCVLWLKGNPGAGKR